MSSEDNPAGKLRMSAMNLLARREHSRSELEQKLAVRFPDCTAVVEDVVGRLADQGLQSDERYVESFCRSRISRGQGRVRIVSELRQKGIGSAVADAALEALGVDWFELALSVARRRFGVSKADTPKEISKRMRFLQYRGFNQDQIRYALENLGRDC